MNIFNTAPYITIAIASLYVLPCSADDPIPASDPVVDSAQIELAGSLELPITQCDASGFDIMDTRNFRLIDYRRMFKRGRTPTPDQMQGLWRGVNKGIVTLVGYKQFVKEIQPCGTVLFGDNIQVHQVSNDVLRCIGWQPKVQGDGQLERQGKFVVKPPDRRRRLIGAAFSHGAVISYRDGGNDRRDPIRLLVDRVVMIDNNHMLGRATANFGPIQIPLAYFMLERVQ